MQKENEMMEHATRQGRLDTLCIRAAEGTLTKQERTELDALFAEREAEEAAVLKPTREKAKVACVLELLRRGDISAGRAAKRLHISRWELTRLMAEAGISPFDDSLTTTTLAAEVNRALRAFDEPTP